MITDNFAEAIGEQESVCQEAHRIVNGPRRKRYGDPLELHELIGRLWAPILGVDEIAPEHVALCMAQVKVAREILSPHRDNRVDLAGYSDVVDRIHELKRTR